MLASDAFAVSTSRETKFMTRPSGFYDWVAGIGFQYAHPAPVCHDVML
jgi:hypothetical protein